MQMKTVFVYLSMIILIGTLIIFVPHRAAAVPPDVTLSFDESEVEIDVGPGESCIGTFNGRVTSRNHAQPVEVNLAVEADYGSTSIDPMSILLGVGVNEETFQVVVMVPNFSSVGSHSVIVTGTANNIPGGLLYELEPVEGIIKINPFMMIRVNSTVEKVTVEAGGEAEISMTIKNDGNHDEQFQVSLSDKNGADIKDWEVVFIPGTPLTIKEGKNESLVLRIAVPEDTPERQYELIISITAGEESDGTAFERDCSLFVDVRSGGIFSSNMWPWLLSALIAALLIFVVIWKRKFILAKFGRKR